ncbi:gephyrin-like molybdotransferase receptor GlpR [Streptomyces sp. TP-A0356]|uniref:divisome protein SepX/GlpR n=1 Tax=Streptomyces sp. TP-A0356 TaxID=1359208 RepID=UPI0006E31073|nr:gephyrin-like molybdotransferase receptor GlpR [Streptomyces sp. TP-A0356]
MSSSGLIYAVIVGAWAAYLVPMWLRRQDELNESRPTERFSTAIRLLSGRAGMERRYAKDLRARSAEEGERRADPDGVTGSVDVRAFAMPPTGQQTRTRVEPEDPARRDPAGQAAPSGAHASAPAARPSAGKGAPRARKAPSAEAEARARRTKVLARRRRTTVMLFLAFTLGAIVAAVGGLAFLWAPGVPAVLLSVYIAYLRAQERKRFTYTMDRRRAEAAAQRLRERHPRRRPPVDSDADETEDGPEPGSDPGLSALAADRRALVEQTDHAEWVDQQRERQRRPGHGESWDPVPVPLPTYVTAPVAPRATPSVDLGAPDSWSSARSSAAEAAPVPGVSGADAEPDSGESGAGAQERAEAGDDGRSDARRAASARRSRERGRTPLFDQYEDGERPRAANE